MTKEQRKYRGEKTVFSTNDDEPTRYLQSKKINLDKNLPPFIKINSKWIIYLKVKHFYHKTIKLLQVNIVENLDNPGFERLFRYDIKSTNHELNN